MSNVSIRPTDHVVPLTTGTVVLLGEFDGVHRGHVELTNSARHLAHHRRVALLAVVADSGGGSPRIMHVGRRCELLLSHGVSLATVTPLAHPGDVRASLGSDLERMHPVAVFVDRESWAPHSHEPLVTYLHSIGADVKYSADHRDATPVRSSVEAIIDRIRAGDVQAASDLLGRPYELTGVISGAAPPDMPGVQFEPILPPVNAVIPPAGVYAARTLIDRRWVGVVVAIDRPCTERSGSTAIAAHLIDHRGRLQYAELSLQLLARIRDDHSLTGSPSAAQIDRDIASVTAFLGTST